MEDANTLRAELEELTAAYEAGDQDSDGLVDLLKRAEKLGSDALALTTDIRRTMLLAGWKTCENCGCWFNGEPTEAGGKLLTLCDDCLDANYDRCDRCGSYVGRMELYLTDGGEYLCERCAMLEFPDDFD